MATVVNVPRDTRFESIGEGIGEGIGAYILHKRRERKQEGQKTAIQKATEIAADESVEDYRARIMTELSPHFKPEQIPSLVDTFVKAREEADRREFESGQQTERLKSAEKRTETSADATIKAANIRAAATKSTAGKKTDQIEIFDEKGNSRKVSVPRGLSDPEVDEYIEGVKASRPQLQGFSRIKPADKSKPTETDKDIEALARDLTGPNGPEALRDQDPTSTPVRDAARRVKRVGPAALRLVQEQYGKLVEDSQGIMQVIYGNRRDTIKGRHALEIVGDIVAEGEDNPGQASAEAVRRTEEWWQNFEYVPENIRYNQQGQISIGAALGYAARTYGIPEQELRDMAHEAGQREGKSPEAIDEFFDRWWAKYKNAPTSGKK